MKKILLLICAAGSLAATGCIAWRGHDHADGQEHRRPAVHDEHSSGVDHREHPGDLEHEENR